jgi:hypothetical protein
MNDVARNQWGRPLINPDCVAGKHAACAGDSWNTETDSPAACPCRCHAVLD